MFLATNTNYEITLNVKDFLWGAFIFALIVMVIFIILLLAKVIKNLSATHKIIVMNQEHISKILQNAGSITSNADTIVENVSKASNAFRPSIENVAEVTESITGTFKENNSINESIVKAYKIIKGANKMVKKHKKDASKDAAHTAQEEKELGCTPIEE